MNDDLKKYIQDHRDEFDHLEPSPAVFNQIRAELKAMPKSKKGVLQLIGNYKWAVAASFTVMMFGAYLIINSKLTPKTNPAQQLVKKEVPQNSEKNTVPPVAQKAMVAHQNTPVKNAVKPDRLNTERSKMPETIDLPALYANLADSSSASTRLAAILKLKESTAINNDMIDRLAKTLNNDPNSNVRLAVLDLMGNYVQYGYVTQVFIQSLVHQSDPSVQLELIQLLAQTNDAKLDEKLYALANDPSTLSAVKDQAYLVLLNQNKL
jgi:hypothetical protein